MIDVACPSCKATYQLDERRVPAQGMQMRCPKCGASFRVDHPQSKGAPKEPVLGAALGLARPPVPARPSVAERPAPPVRERPAPPSAEEERSTVLGVAPEAGGPRRGTKLELAEIDDPPETDEEPGLLDFGFGDDGADLPAPVGRSAPAGPGLDLGLPDLVVDLPEPAGNLARAAARAPATRQVPRAAPRMETLDLPDLAADLPMPSAGLPDVHAGLPEVGASLPEVGGSLPDLAAGVPDVAASAPDLAGGLPDLGASLSPPRADSIRLPSLSDGLSEPSPSPPEESWSLESWGAAAPSSSGDTGEASFRPTADPFGTGPTTRPVTDPDGLAPGRAAPPASFDDEEFDAFPTEVEGAKPKPKDTSSLGGGAGYGEVQLDGGAGELGLGDSIGPPQPEGLPGAPAAATAVVTRPTGETTPIKKTKPKGQGVSRPVRIIGSVGLLLALSGGALAVLPDVGPFGAFIILDTIKKDTYEAELASDRAQVWTKLSRDTSADFDDALRFLLSRRDSAPRYRPRLAFTAYLGSLRQLKFGADGSASAEARALLDVLKEANPAEVPYLTLARTAGAALEKKGPEARVADPSPGKDEELTILSAEVLLREGEAEQAKAAFGALAQKNRSPLAVFGLARAATLLEDRDEALKLTTEVLGDSPAHLGAKLLAIKLEFSARSEDEATMNELVAISQDAKVSQKERAQALILLGDLHLSRARLKQAEAAYNDALKLNAGSPEAQRGLADALFEAGRFSEALARYEAASHAAPSDVSTKLGVVRAKLRLEQYEDAAKLLATLSQSHPENTRVLYWEGRAKEAIGDREAAAKAYERAVKSDQEGAELVEAMIALTRLLGQAGKQDAAEQSILRALERFPKEPRVYRALGELAESRGRYDEAILRFEEAQKLDPNNVGIRFQKGVALRKARRFEEAARELDAVESIEKDYPGLALERGNLFEAAGRSAEALKAYESALAQAPTDPDLMLRVGCGKAMAGFSKDAIELLTKVAEERPTSAELNFCLGLAYFKDGKDLPMAKRIIERAIGLDASRAPYHLYAGWIALEMRDFSTAGRFLDKAIELDQTLGDAYWQRGVLRVRQGAVDDAERDLRRALELSPSRFEAHASLAEAYLQMGREDKALAAFALAAQGGPLEPYVQFRYGKLLVDNHRPGEAIAQLEAALKNAPSGAETPSWVWEAHRELGMALGRKKEAIAHYQAFLENGPSDSPYRAEALKEIKAILAILGR